MTSPPDTPASTIPPARWDWGTGLVTIVECPRCNWGAASMSVDKLEHAYKEHWQLEHGAPTK